MGDIDGDRDTDDGNNEVDKDRDTSSDDEDSDDSKTGTSDMDTRTGSRGSWVNEDIRVYEDHIVDLCYDVEEAWLCVEKSLKVLHRRTRSVLHLLLTGLKTAVEEKCRRKLK